VLDLEPGAAEEDVRRAYRRTREIYAFGAMSTLGLYSNQRLESMQRRIEEAYDVLIDPERRRRYDLEIFPEGTGQHPQQPGVDRLSPGLLRMPSENEPELGPESEYSGGLLRQIREARAIELADIAQRTRIGVGHLRAIEGEEYGRMPAQVYLRGFLVEYARCLGLDVARVVDTYLARYRRAGANSEQ
jgi:flagellar biosynthesis protein FlhG